MGLKETIAAGVTTAMGALGNLVETITLTQPDTIDQVTEAVTPGASGSWRAVESKFNQLEVATGQVQAGDLKLLADDADKPFTPKQGQKVVFRGVTYELHQADPLQESLWTLHLRRPQ